MNQGPERLAYRVRVYNGEGSREDLEVGTPRDWQRTNFSTVWYLDPPYMGHDYVHIFWIGHTSCAMYACDAQGRLTGERDEFGFKPLLEACESPSGEDATDLSMLENLGYEACHVTGVSYPWASDWRASTYA